MVLLVIQIGKTDNRDLQSAIDDYFARINRMLKLEILTIPDIKNRKSLPVKDQIKEESVKISRNIRNGDYIIVLDEKGKDFSSRQFSNFISSRMNEGAKRLVFIIGGPWGTDPDLKLKANTVLSLSRMTFPHQLVRLLFTEQLYRALTILNGIPYHND